MNFTFLLYCHICPYQTQGFFLRTFEFEEIHRRSFLKGVVCFVKDDRGFTQGSQYPAREAPQGRRGGPRD